MYKKDGTIAPLSFNMDVYKSTRKLRIGYYKTHDWFETCPTSQRAVTEVVAKLREAGHVVVEWQPPSIETAVKLFYGIMLVASFVFVYLSIELFCSFVSSHQFSLLLANCDYFKLGLLMEA